jgi:hypothetical protein
MAQEAHRPFERHWIAFKKKGGDERLQPPLDRARFLAA